MLNNVAAYSRSQTRGTTNSNDGIFDENMTVPLSGDYSAGYSGTVDIGPEAGGRHRSKPRAGVDRCPVIATDQAGNRKVIRRRVRVPRVKS